MLKFTILSMKHRRYLSLLLLLSLTLPTVAQAQYYYVVRNGTVEITGYTNRGGAEVIPETINGLPVTSVGLLAFYWCTRLTSITIPKSVISIHNRAFKNCTNLVSVTIANGLTGIDVYAFEGCSKLTTIRIPESVSLIGGGAFEGCTSLTEITVDGINPVYGSLDGVLFNKSFTALLKYPEAKTGAFTIPDSVTIIGPGFFSGCSRLTSLTVPDSVTTIGDGAFDRCTGLTEITVDPLNPVYSSLDGVLFNKGLTALLRCPEGKTGGFTIPDSVTSIGPTLFSGCSRLTSLTIPDSVTTIGNESFTDCGSLANITIGNRVTSIGLWTFSGCTNLTSVYFRGNPPIENSWPGFHTNVTVYYLPGTTGWISLYAERPTALWVPITPNVPSLTSESALKLVTSPPAPATVRVQRSVNLIDWEDWQTVSRDGGPSELQDPDAGTTPYRFYRGIEE